MGDFKCKSGVSSDNMQQDLNKDNNNNFDAVNNPAEDSNYNNGINARYNENNDYSQRENESDYNRSNDYSKSAGEGCGCGSIDNDYKSSDFSDDLQYPDDSQTATIYSETIIFTDPYNDIDQEPATSSLTEDAQEGSEYISSDSNPSKPMC